MITLPLGDDYINITPLNQGGMGWLYKAYRKGLQVDVVIKRVKAQYAGKVNQRAEADILKRLKHRYLPQIYDVIDGGDGYLYTVMDYISGINMQQYVQQNGAAGQKVAHKWACQLCEVVAYLHEQHPPIIHCDIKPSNLMITPSGDICLVDFNTSLIFSSGVLAVGATTGYAAPEQYIRPSSQRVIVPPNQPTVLVSDEEELTSSDTGGVTVRTDVYGIGATLYYLVTGHVPEKAVGSVTPVTAYSPKVSGVFCSMIQRAMEKKPKDRFADASQILRALQSVDRLDIRYRRYQIIRIISNLLIILLLLLGIILALYGGFKIRSEREYVYLSLISQGESLAQGGDTAQAESILRQAIQSAPGRAEGYLTLSYQLYVQGAYPESYALIQNAVESGSLLLDNLPKEQAGTLLYIQANCAYELEDYALAIDDYQRALTYQIDDIKYYRGLALAQVRSGKLEEAHQTLAIVSDMDVNSVDYWIIQAELDLIEGEYQAAFDRYAETAEQTDDWQILSRIYQSGAEALEKMGDLDGRIAWLSQGVGRLGDNGIIQAEMLAEAYAEKAVADPENRQEWYGQAETHLQRVVDSGRGNILTQLNLAVVKENLGEFEEAESCLLSLRVQYPTDYRVYMRLTFLYADWQSQMPVKERDYSRTVESYGLALQYYEQAVANGESDDEMQRLEALIEQLRISGWIG